MVDDLLLIMTYEHVNFTVVCVHLCHNTQKSYSTDKIRQLFSYVYLIKQNIGKQRNQYCNR